MPESDETNLYGTDLRVARRVSIRTIQTTSDRFDKLPGAIWSAAAPEGARAGRPRDNRWELANGKNGGACDYSVFRIITTREISKGISNLNL